MFIPDSPLYSVFTLRCPACHTGKLFLDANPYNLKNVEKMPAHCPHCQQNFQPEPGFYFGASYVSYAFIVAIIVITLIGGYGLLGLSPLTCFMFVVSINLLLAPLLFRLSRAVWAHFFISYKGTTSA